MESKGRSLLDGSDMQRHELFHGDETPPLKSPGLPKVPALDRDRPPHIRKHAQTNYRPAPAEHRPKEEPGHDALGCGRGKPCKGIQSGERMVRNREIDR